MNPAQQFINLINAGISKEQALSLMQLAAAAPAPAPVQPVQPAPAPVQPAPAPVQPAPVQQPYHAFDTQQNRFFPIVPMQQYAQIPPTAGAPISPAAAQNLQQYAQIPLVQQPSADPFQQLMQAIKGVETSVQAAAIAQTQQPNQPTFEDIQAEIVAPKPPVKP